jgi:ArsR family transcriptional regulator
MSGQLTSVFKAIADPTRREILHLLRVKAEEMSAGEIASHFDMTKPTMSHHFSVLKEAELITSRREGQTIWYALNTTVLEDVLAWTMDMARGAKGEKE